MTRERDQSAAIRQRHARLASAAAESAIPQRPRVAHTLREIRSGSPMARVDVADGPGSASFRR